MTFENNFQLLNLLLTIAISTFIIYLTKALEVTAENTASLKCHQEYNQDITSRHQEDSEKNFNLGDIAIFECNATGETWNINHRSKASFAIYPHSKRTCVSNDVGSGMWSAPLPMCINIRSDINGAAREIEAFDVKNCIAKNGTSECPSMKTWRRIGEFHGFCNSVEMPPNDITSYEFLLSFVRPYYFSFVTFPSKDFFDVQFFAKTKSVIKNLSLEAQNFLSNHYLYWKSAVNDIRQGKDCASTNMAIFTDSLRLHFSVKDDGNNHELRLDDNQHYHMLEKFRFYRILKCYETEAPGPTECFKEPTISSASKLAQHSDGNSLKFICNDPGYVMVDPDTNTPSDGTMKCIESDWIPYPYPVCKHFSLIGTSKASISEPQEEKPIFIIITAASLLALGILSSLVIGIVCIILRKKDNIRKKTLARNPSLQFQPSSTRLLPGSTYRVTRQDERENDIESLHSSNRIREGLGHEYDYPALTMQSYMTTRCS